ncbi:TrbM/KikA/MpfK family conjugal transfer protein [Limnohabitans sp.]|jgi:hypothetical protein|uniref:TrbM/KikA/MpfK family conjugal transfer protein n=1 Tax=Limnohabitans sp. TaxID=1907725 RepID=UPI0028A26AD2|nr:TrbM/KikA/MpfK family conjugal transfer protein [Limnohabitans sp.]
MKIKPLYRVGFALGLLASIGGSPAHAQGQLDGDAKLACEALLCLAASSRPTECIPPIRRYFSISYRRFSDTLRGRLNFLNLCPVVSQPNMASFKNAIVNGAGRCDSAAINQASYVSTWEGESYVANSMPQYCVAYYGNGLVQASAPVYVGEPMQGGHWVEAQDYPQALQAYNDMRAKAAAEAAAAALAY